jgi:hypothetical protein
VKVLNSILQMIFFDKSNRIDYQKRRGAQPLVHREYTRGTREKVYSSNDLSIFDR